MKNRLQHLAIIMDGNRRWAKSKNKPIFIGHQKGYEVLRKIADHCMEKKIKILTVFAFSTENWKRTKKEVGFLLNLFAKALSEQIDYMHSKGARIRFIGDLSAFPAKLINEMKRGMLLTKNNKNFDFNVAVNYGGRQEILMAFKKIIKSKVNINKLNEKNFGQYLDTAQQVDPDLIIRTSGEQRLSGFLTWQSVYSELYFTQKHWPDFTCADLDAAIDQYYLRQRRFGN